MNDLSRLKSQLLNTGLQVKDNPLFQVIDQLIRTMDELNKSIKRMTVSGSTGGSFATIISGGTIGPPGMGFDGDDGNMGPPGIGRDGDDGIDGILLYDFGGNTIEWVQSATPTWVSANARQISIDGGLGGGIHVLTVRIRAASGNVTARLRDITNNVTAGTSGVVAAGGYGTEIFNITLSAGIAIYEVQLLPSIANTDVNLGSAYMDAAPSLITSIGPAGPVGSIGPMGMFGEDGEIGMPIPGLNGYSISIYEQPTEPTDARPGDIWIVSA